MMKSWLLLFTFIINISCTEIDLNKRDVVTTSIATFLTTQPGGNVITIQTPTIITVAETTTSSSTPATTSSTSATVDAIAAAAAVTTSTTSTASSSSTDTTAVAAADTTTAVNTKGVAEVTTGNFLGVAKSSTTSKASGTKTENTDVYTGPRENPSTSITPLPSTPVTTLKIESYQTITMKHTTYTTTRAKTSMYVTLTVQSMVEVIQTTFAQRFKTMYSSTFSGSSGSIGLGTLSGEIGKVRSSYTYSQVGSNNAIVNANNWSLLGMLLSTLYMFI